MLRAALLILFLTVNAFADKYDIKQVKVTVLDRSGAAWTDTTAYLGVRLDSAKKENLEEQEISAGTISYGIGEEYKRYSLRIEAGACLADVPFVVYKDADKPIYYELTLLRKEGERYTSVPLSTRLLAISSTSRDRMTVNATITRPMLVSDWLLYGGIMLASAVMVYVLFFRWLFSVLLFQHNWPVSRAEYFTTSLSLLFLVAVFGFLLVLFIPQTVVTWTILSLLALLWAGHAVVWALS